MTPRFFVINPVVAAIALAAQAALGAVLLFQIRDASKDALEARARLGAVDAERAECMSVARLAKYQATECELWRESLKTKIERMAQACAVYP